MAGQPVSLAEAIRAGTTSALDEVHTAMPGEVISYDPALNAVAVRPSLKQGTFSTSGKRTYYALPDLISVPVVWPRGGGFVFRTPLSPGDRVLILFSEGGLAEWKRTGGVSEPVDARRFSVGWPVAIRGLYPTCEPLSPVDAAAVAAGQAIFGEDGGRQMRVGPTGVEFGPSGVTPIAPVALAPPLLAYLALLHAAVVANTAAITALAADPTHLVPSTGTAVAAAGTATTAATGGVAAMTAGTPSTLVRSV